MGASNQFELEKRFHNERKEHGEKEHGEKEHGERKWAVG